MEDKKCFFSVLFDLNFTEFLTPRIIKLFFILGILGSVVFTFAFIVAGFNSGPLGGLVSLLLSPLMFLFMVIACRVWLELIMLGFKIANNTTLMLKKDAAAPEQPK